MAAHAKLSPSSAERWLQCPGSVGLVARSGVEEESSVYADEGTKAHTVAEIRASLAFGKIDDATYWRKLQKWERDTPEEWHEDQLAHADQYVELLSELMEGYDHPQLLLEQRMSTGVPGCWGTGDAVIVSPDTIHVVDYKYGKGVAVNAYENPQLKLYGLGALETFGLLGEIEIVRVTVHQPRLESLSTFSMDVVELRKWRDHEVKPMAELALSGKGHLAPSESACRWCPVAGECKTRAEYVTKRDFGDPDLLSPEEIADALEVLPDIRSWCKDLEELALRRAYHEGVELPGWKVIRSGGKRQILDSDKAIDLLEKAGFDQSEVAKTSVQTLTELDKVVGKADLQKILGKYLDKTPGRESLVPVEHPSPAVSALAEATSEFESEDK